MARFQFFVVQFVLLISFVASGAIPDNVRKAMKDLASSDPTEVSAAMQTVTENPSQYYYTEIFRSLVEATNDGLSAMKYNTYIIGGGLKALAEYSGPGQDQELNNILQKFDSVRGDMQGALSSNVFPHMVAAYNVLESSTGNGNIKLETLINDDAPIKKTGPVESIKTKLGKKKKPAAVSNADDTTLAEIIAAKAGKAGEIVLGATASVIRDDNNKKIESGKFIPVLGRDEDAKKVLEVLARIEGSNAALIGTAGSGKSSIVKLIDKMSADGVLPKGPAFEGLQDLVVLETTPARISRIAQSDSANAQAAALEAYVDSVIATQSAIGKTIVVFIDEAHTLGESQVEALKRYMASQDGVKFVFASTSEEFNMAFKSNKAFNRRVKVVPIEELSEEKAYQVIKDSWMPKIESRYNVSIDEDVFVRLLKEYINLNPDGGRIDGTIKSLQDIAIRYQNSTITKEQLSEFILDYYSLPVDPQDRVAFRKFIVGVRAKINQEVIGQERMVEDMVSEYGKLLQNKTKSVTSIYAMGPTGVGKTFTSELLAKNVLSNSNALLEINGNEYMNGGYDLNALFGAPNGVISSDTTSGRLMEWLDDPSQGGKGGVLVFNEIDKMHPDGLKRIMELLDRGVITGGDGKTRHVKNLMIVFTSNRGVDMTFPDGWEKWTASEREKFISTLSSDDLKKRVTTQKSGNYRDDKKMPPEILNRIDLFTVGAPISEEDAIKVGHKSMNDKVAEALSEYEVKLNVDPGVVKHIVDSVYNPKFGARPVNRGVNKYYNLMIDEAIVNEDLSGQTEINISLDASGENFVLTAGKVQTTLKAPKLEADDPLSDPETMSLLRGFEEKMSSELFGQEEVVSQIYDAVLSYKSGLVRDKALSFFLVGSTGTGKSETAKVLANVMYENRERTAFINLGDLRHDFDMSTVFNPPTGVTGGDKAGLFEQALIENPEGGVILFDEASNMGGNDKAKKNDLFKKLYEITDEKTWTSTATGAAYDLSKYIFIFTGNDGEELFQGVDADDLRLATWRDNRDKASDLLAKNGVPEAFMGRMAGVMLQKPLIRSIVANKIVPKFIQPLVNKLKSAGVPIKVNISEETRTNIGMIFFTQKQGARSIKNVIDRQVNALITLARMHMVENDISSDVKLEVTVEDSFANQIYIKDTNQDRKVQLVANLVNSKGKVIESFSKDATQFADKTHLMTKDQARLTAFHEAGHAIANDPDKTHQKLAFITIKGRGEYLGYARYEKLKGSQSTTHETVIAQMAKSLAGSAAQQMAGYPADAGMSGDIKHARTAAMNAILKFGIYSEFSHIEAEAEFKSLDSETKKAVTKKSKELFDEAWTEAVKVLEDNWAAVDKVAEVLLKQGEISGDEFKDIQSQSLKVKKPKLDDLKKTKNFFAPSCNASLG